jgi:hypothetical protein
LLLAAVALAGPAAAQTRARSQAPREPAFEVGGGGGAAGALDLGESTASLRANSVQSAPYPLFSAQSRVDRAAFITAHVGYHVTRALTAEGRVSVGRPALHAVLSGDAESAPRVDATTPTTEYLFEGGALLRLTSLALGRTIPFVAGGAGVTRHLYDERVLVETGRLAYVGGGLLHAIGGRRGAASRLSVRLDVRLQMLDGGIAEGHDVSSRAAIAGSLVAAF